jgi:acetyl-CoA carboxylase biotin carboxylase subunit
MGDKARARRVMKKAGVPILPGSDGPIDNEEKALKLAKEIGYPVIVKATAGGGGRGMRVVRAPAELSHAVKTAQREAEAAFGVGRRLHREVRRVAAPYRVPDPRRSLRIGDPPRRARVLDPAPPPEADRGVAVAGAQREDAPQDGRHRHRRRPKAVQYTNAGTFEFLMDPDGRFYFMEANTRLQVEHPVTEMVTGIDIVKEQIRIAAGERSASSRARSPSPATRSSAASTPRIRRPSCPRPA